MIAKVEYTESIPLRKVSSLVEGIFYNQNNNTVTFDLQDRIYRYGGVSRNDVVTVANAPSPGSEYQHFKRKFGPGEALGGYNDIEWQKVSPQVSVGNGVYINGEKVGLYASGGKIESGGINPSVISAFRINLAKEAAVIQTFKVGFVVVQDNGVTGSVSNLKSHQLHAKSFDDAASQVIELGKMLDLEFKVREVAVVD